MDVFGKRGVVVPSMVKSCKNPLENLELVPPRFLDESILGWDDGIRMFLLKGGFWRIS